MFRKLATIQKITNIRKIAGADKIEVAEVLGWEIVIRKGEFQIGELVVYVEVDSIMPALPDFEFLKERKYRVRTIKLRGQVSQGICFPLSILPKKKFKEGDDVTEIIGVVKYDPEAAKEQAMVDAMNAVKKSRIEKFLMRNKWYRRFFTKAGKRGWPKFIQKTDEERIQKIPNICEKEKGTLFVATEKLDGQSATYALLRVRRWWWRDKFEFIVCSRNLHLRTTDNSSYWTIAKSLNIEKVLLGLILGTDEYVVLQGEIIGEGIQKNKYNIKGYDFYAFNLIHSCGGKRTDSEMRSTLKNSGVKCVPLLHDNTFLLRETIQECVESVKGKSTLNDVYREGIVVRNYVKNISFKIINPDFLLKYQDEFE